jgi:predicted membrane chloride channel (bestrophin family)
MYVVFRTNASYERWREARQLWGSITTQSCNVARMASNWASSELELRDDVRQQLVQDVANAAWAFSRSLQMHLAGEEEEEEEFFMELKMRLPAADAEALIGARHRPNRALYQLSRAVEALPMERYRKNEIDHCITTLQNNCGACEQIYQTPVPLIYTRQTARFLTFWLLGLPLALWEPFATSWNHTGMIGAAGQIAVFLFSIEELAIQMEEPFGLLNLRHLIDNSIGQAVDEYADWHDPDDIADYISVDDDLLALGEATSDTFMLPSNNNIAPSMAEEFINGAPLSQSIDHVVEIQEATPTYAQYRNGLVERSVPLTTYPLTDTPKTDPYATYYKNGVKTDPVATKNPYKGEDHFRNDATLSQSINDVVQIQEATPTYAQYRNDLVERSVPLTTTYPLKDTPKTDPYATYYENGVKTDPVAVSNPHDTSDGSKTDPYEIPPNPESPTKTDPYANYKWK